MYSVFAWSTSSLGFGTLLSRCSNHLGVVLGQIPSRHAYPLIGRVQVTCPHGMLVCKPADSEHAADLFMGVCPRRQLWEDLVEDHRRNSSQSEGAPKESHPVRRFIAETRIGHAKSNVANEDLGQIYCHKFFLGRETHQGSWRMVRSRKLQVKLLVRQDPVSPVVRRINSTILVQVQTVATDSVCGLNVEVVVVQILK